MPDDRRFEAALAAAMDILDQLASKPGLEYPARLSIATYAILDAMNRQEPAGAKHRASGGAKPNPASPSSAANRLSNAPSSSAGPR